MILNQDTVLVLPDKPNTMPVWLIRVCVQFYDRAQA